jgi:hypothetical protein
MDCGVPVPDSVLLRGRTDRLTAISAWIAEDGWQERKTPVSTDTMTVSVVRAVCAGKDSVLTYLVLQSGHAFLALFPSSISSNDDSKEVGAEQDVAFVRRGATESALLRVNFAGKLHRMASASMVRDSMGAWRGRVARAEQRVVAQRRQALMQRGWPASSVELILTRRIAIGMSADMVREAIGRPERINRTITAGAVSEQWVFANARYLTFRDGVLRTIQDSR